MTTTGARRGLVGRRGARVGRAHRDLFARVDWSTGRARPLDPGPEGTDRGVGRTAGWSFVPVSVNSGASATDDRRPQFQRMIERACDGENAFDLIVVHSFSQFFRDAFGLEFYLRKPAKHGVKLSRSRRSWAIPRPDHDRQVIALFDEYQSKENAKHVLRSMKENTRQGFWNGSRPPLGYKIVEAERRGARAKKKLAIDPVEAETVRLVFRLFVAGDGGSGRRA